MNDKDDLGGDIIEISDDFMDEVRTMRFFSLASVDGAVQTARRFPASATSCNADMGIGVSVR